MCIQNNKVDTHVYTNLQSNSTHCFPLCTQVIVIYSFKDTTASLDFFCTQEYKVHSIADVAENILNLIWMFSLHFEIRSRFNCILKNVPISSLSHKTFLALIFRLVSI